MENLRIFALILLPLLLFAPATAQSRVAGKPSQPLKTGPPFTLSEQNGVWWLVTPEGKPFFSLGVCCVTPGTPWLEYNPQNPSYAAWQEYPDPVSWADTTVERLKSWGFTTIGGWSDIATLKRSPQMSLFYTLVLHVGSSAGAPWWDMWDPKVIRTMEEVAEKQIVPVRNDPHLLGYYTDNEMGWWNATLFHMTLQHSPHSEQRRRLVRMLREHYHNDWSRLCKDFAPEKADSFAALDKAGDLYLRPGSDGMQQIKQFIRMVAERYYALVRQVVHKYDPRGLLLGDRYQSFYYPEVARASRRYVDAVSTNMNASWQDGTIARFYLDTLHALAARPVLIGEFYMTAMENSSGNKNDSSGFPVVATQEERAVHFRTTLESLLRTPYVAGADWFQYTDEPTFGRGDGENYDMGLVDIHDRPYAALTATAVSVAREALHARPAAPRANALGGVPRAPEQPTANWRPMEALQNWDREHGFVPPSSRYPVGDLYLCWDEKAIYVGLYAIDIVENGYYKDKRIPEADRAELTLRIGGRAQPIRIRLGAGRAPRVTGANVEVASLSGLEHDARNIAVVTLPAALFGKQNLSPGDRIDLAATLLTHAHAYRVEWAGKYQLSTF